MKKRLASALPLMSLTSYADTPGFSQSSSLPSILMLVVFIGIFYFLMIRPQMKRSKEQRQLLGALQKGDEVVTASGLCGVVHKVEETAIEVEIASKVVVKFQKQAITGLLPNGTVHFE